MVREKNIPKYMIARGKKQLPLNKREFLWLQKRGIISSTVKWEDFKFKVKRKK